MLTGSKDDFCLLVLKMLQHNKMHVFSDSLLREIGAGLGNCGHFCKKTCHNQLGRKMFEILQVSWI